jgi:hypothetical protein
VTRNGLPPDRSVALAAVASLAAVVAMMATACSTGPVGQRGSLTASDVGPGWVLTAVNRGPRFDQECESRAFDGSLPSRITPERTVETEYVRNPHRSANGDSSRSVYVLEFVMQFADVAAANRALQRYKDVATQCTVGGDLTRPNGDQHIVDDTSTNVLTNRTSDDVLLPAGTKGAKVSVWADFVVVDDRAIWLVAQNTGTVQDMRALAAKAAARLAGLTGRSPRAGPDPASSRPG